MTDREISKEKMLRYIYIIEVDNRGKKSKYFGHKNIYYVGETNNISKRLREHLMGVGSKFINKNFRDARKIPIYIEQLMGDEYDAMVRETRIKRLRRDKKDELVRSAYNDLVNYIPTKAVILRNLKNPEELISIPI